MSSQHSPEWGLALTSWDFLALMTVLALTSKVSPHSQISVP